MDFEKKAKRKEKKLKSEINALKKKVAKEKKVSEKLEANMVGS